ncbi:DUF2306 domain-containing protein [Cryptosporangium minutisporangium]|uniref:DUF2306 domain-containing protein n=1 Tax=Cryptosporangium minutisporangium TaxID=113569 RepID=A0ABP6STT4_9ACTN
MPAHPVPRRTSDWLVPVALLLLAFIPVVAGAVRVTELASGPAVTPENARFVAAPIPIVVHIVSVTLFAVLGALQFAPRLRRHRWHRWSGRIVAPSGMVAALSGVWITLFSGRAETDGNALAVVRVVVGVAMTAFLVLGVRAIRRRDVATHRRWMVRGYALGIAAGTQAFTQAPWLLLVGPLDVPSKTVLTTAGWLINIAVAEWVLRRPTPGRARPDQARPDQARPDQARHDPARHDGARPGSARPDHASPVGARPDFTSPDSTSPDGARPDHARSAARPRRPRADVST